MKIIGIPLYLGICIGIWVSVEHCLGKIKIRKGLKKWKIPLRWVGGVSIGPFFHYFFLKINKSLEHLVMPKKNFKTNLFGFSLFDGGLPSSATIMVGCEA